MARVAASPATRLLESYSVCIFESPFVLLFSDLVMLNEDTAVVTDIESCTSR